MCCLAFDLWHALTGGRCLCSVICFMITMICFFIIGIIQLVIGTRRRPRALCMCVCVTSLTARAIAGALARADNCRNTDAPLWAVACRDGWQYFFALTGMASFDCLSLSRLF